MSINFNVNPLQAFTSNLVITEIDGANHEMTHLVNSVIYPIDFSYPSDNRITLVDPDDHLVAELALNLLRPEESKNAGYLKQRKELFLFIQSQQHLKAFHKISESELYKLFIDGNRWPKKGSTSSLEEQLTFDKKEIGYTKAMMQGFIFLFENLHRKIDAQFIEDLHDIATKQVIASDVGEPLELGFRSHQRKDQMETFGLKQGETLSDLGKRELLDKMHDSRYDFMFDGEKWNVFELFISNPRNTIDRLVAGEIPRLKLYPPRVKGILEEAVNHLIRIYDSAPKNSENEKLNAIINLVQGLEQIHPFYDGNIRTFAILLIQRLLFELDLKPVCFKDPNCFDCLSVAELRSKIEEAQALFGNI